MEKYANAYFYSKKNGWLDEIFSHMGSKPIGYWNNKERCLEASLNCDSRSEFIYRYCSAYGYALKNGWLDEIYSNLKVKGNLKMRKIYAFEFSNNHVYVGLSYNPELRRKKHFRYKEKSAVYKFVTKNPNVKYEFKILTSEFLPIEIISEMENEYIEKYKHDGWVVLNVARGGSVGGSRLYWTYERCEEITKMYNCLEEFRVGNPKCYRAVRTSGWVNELCSHMDKPNRKPNGFWEDRKVCEDEVLKFTHYTVFYKEQPGCLSSIKKHGWNELLSHLKWTSHKEKGHWTRERCKEEALKYKSKSEFRKNSSGCYGKSKMMGWLGHVCSHMKKTNLRK
jgi:hypothetical protein